MNDKVKTEEKKQPEVEYVAIEDEELKGKQADEGKKPEDDEDERLNKQEDDAEVNAAATDEEREAIRERRRKERAERKARREEAISRDKLELEFLRKRNDDLERRFNVLEQRTVQQDVAGIDGAISQTRREITMAEEVIAKAVSAGNGEDAVKATRIRDQASQRLQALAAQKANMSQQRQQDSGPQMDSTVLNHAKRFINENSWYNPRGGDEDSDIVISIDRSLAREGLNPQTEEYWEKLREKVRKRLPEKFEGSKDDPKRRESRGGPQIGSGKGDASHVSGRQEVYISPDRKNAMIEAGVWDDPVLRQKYIKRYAEYDKNNPRS